MQETTDPVEPSSRNKRGRQNIERQGSQLQIEVFTHDAPANDKTPTGETVSDPQFLQLSGDSSSCISTNKHIVTVSVSPMMIRRESSSNLVESNDGAQPVPNPPDIRVGVSAVQGRRKTMEDAHTYLNQNQPEEEEKELSDSLKKSMIDTFGQDKSKSDDHINQNDFAFFGVFDGHGGKLASDYAAKHLHGFVLESPSFKTNIVEAIKEGFAKTEETFLKIAEKDCLADGTTALVSFIVKNKLFIGSVGDSEAVMCKNGKAIALSSPHNPAKNPEETKRVEAAGGRVVGNRVAHPALNPAFFSIAVSRAIGDLMFKSPSYTSGKVSGLIADAEVTEWDLESDCQFIILACDGLWDVLKHQEAVDFVVEKLKENDDPQLTSQLLVEKAYEEGSMDNITAMLVTLGGVKSG
eukprot:TRINITY_DN23831_c0_g1_i1.p1 TRINITY_DN23831_c0_g1~~TRINITY_DN23831_c0_g1_i1.p1  ORF type:complete len:409 (+),score=110.36 TRINITY_DN23831_c0_g1_i1:35-1261(+)